MGYSMRTPRYRLTEWLGADGESVAFELYDHQEDPGEDVNLANQPDHRELVARLTRKLHAGSQSAMPK
jgi:hypothetical protein